MAHLVFKFFHLVYISATHSFFCIVTPARGMECTARCRARYCYFLLHPNVPLLQMRITCIMCFVITFDLCFANLYTGCSLTCGTNLDSLYKNPQNVTFSRITKCPKMLRYRDIELVNIWRFQGNFFLSELWSQKVRNFSPVLPLTICCVRHGMWYCYVVRVATVGVLCVVLHGMQTRLVWVNVWDVWYCCGITCLQCCVVAVLCSSSVA